MLMLIYIGVIAFVVSGGVVWLQWRRAASLGLFDVPKSHSSHSVTVPSGGGLGLLFGMFAGISLVAWREADWNFLLPFLPLLPVGIVSLVDDFRSLPAVLRLFVQLGAGTLVLHLGGFQAFDLGFLGIGVSSPLISSVLAIGGMLLICNIFNFMDGIDGFAGSQALVSGVLLVSFVDDPLVRVWGMGMAGASAGFLLFNWYPAKIFLGDIGSVSVGFALASLPFLGAGGNRKEILFWIVIPMWFFLLDGIITLIRRLFEGEKLWKSHRTHFYQRWANSGVRHSTVCLWVHVGGVVLIYLPLGVLTGLDVEVVDRAAVAAALGMGYYLVLRKFMPRRFRFVSMIASKGEAMENRDVADSVAQE